MRTKIPSQRLNNRWIILSVLLLITPLSSGCAIYFGSLGSDLDEGVTKELVAHANGYASEIELNDRITIVLKDGNTVQGIALDADTLDVLLAEPSDGSMRFLSVANADITSVKKQKTEHFWRNVGIIIGVVLDVVILVP